VIFLQSGLTAVLLSINVSKPGSCLGGIMRNGSLCLWGLAWLLFLSVACEHPADFDCIIDNGLILDGTGGAGVTGGVAIRDGVIVEVGELSSRSATRVIDAKGRAVAPGFIDMMGGSSIPLLTDPVSAESKLRQGITTMVAGEGTSMAPQNEETFALMNRNGALDREWRTFDEYIRILEDKGIALNVIHNVGAAQVRRIAIGEQDREPTGEELEEMKALLAQAMQDGAVGLSSALIYPPGAYAKTEELIELAKVVAEYDGIYLTHVRNESGQVLEAIEEAIRIGREAALPVHVYHLKAAGQENWPLMEEALELIEKTRAEGIEITADIYPYIRNGIGLGSFIHPRHFAEGPEALITKLSGEAFRSELRREIETTSDWENWYRHVGQDWDNVLVTRVPPASNPEFVGLSVKGVAEKRGVDVWQAFFDLVQEAGRRGISTCPKSMNEEQKKLAMKAPFVCFDTDASPTNPGEVASSHPRAFGAFPRVLAKYVREDDVIPLEEAVRKLTSLPASILGIEDRGRIAPSMAADLVIFDPRTVRDTATFTNPLSYSEGIDTVLVNGQVVIEEGKRTEVFPGEALRHRAR
jgi:N-acyl-D-aspartate/D-glutamate deacylase